MVAAVLTVGRLFSSPEFSESSFKLVFIDKGVVLNGFYTFLL